MTGQPNWDERMEAMRQQLELLSSMHLENEREHDRWQRESEMRQRESEMRQRENDRRFAEVAHEFAEVAQGFREVRRNFEVCLDSIKRLERIAVAHDLQIDDIDARLTELEQRRRPQA